MTIKQVTVMRKDLKMRRGKEISQGSHGACSWLSYHVRYVESQLLDVLEIACKAMETGDAEKLQAALGTLYAINCDSKIRMTDEQKSWTTNLFTKICLQVNSEAELLDIYEKAKTAGLTVHLITDAGLTEFNGVPTKTCLTIGPHEAEKIDKITGHLPLY